MYYEMATFNDVKDGEIFYPASSNFPMCIRIAPETVFLTSDTSQTVNFFNIRDRKFGFLSGLEEVQVPNKCCFTSLVKNFGVER